MADCKINRVKSIVFLYTTNEHAENEIFKNNTIISRNRLKLGINSTKKYKICRLQNILDINFKRPKLKKDTLHQFMG